MTAWRDIGTSTGWGSRRQLVELCGGRHDGHRFRVEELPEQVEMPEVPGPPYGLSLTDAWLRQHPDAVLVYRRTDIVRESDGAWLYDIEPKGKR